MNDHSKEAERIGAIELVDECGDRLLAQYRERRGEIDQITGVRDRRVDAGLLDACTKRVDVGPIERFPAPLVRVFREDLQRLTPVYDGPIHCLCNAAGDRHVRADA
jgi:hypothetical protein